MRRSRHWIELMAALAADLAEAWLDPPTPGPATIACPRARRTSRWVAPVDTEAARAALGLPDPMGREPRRCADHRPRPGGAP